MTRPYTKRPEIERFLEKVVVLDDEQGACWQWIASLYPSGYAQFRWGGRNETGHRFSYQHFVGVIPLGMQIDHLCRNRACVNPDHLEAVTPRENTRRGLHCRPRTHCPHDHEFTPANTYVTPQGVRVCRTCNRLRMRGIRPTQQPREGVTV